MSGKLRQRKKQLETSQKEDNHDASDIQSLLNGIIDEEAVTKATGEKNMINVRHLSLQIDTNNQSILNIAELLPNLCSLTLDQSIICSVRDLGVGLAFII